MAAEIKVKGITRRWMVNILSTIVIGVVVVEVAFGLFIYSYFCSIARSNADSYARFFTGLSYSTADKFSESARQYVGKFQHSDSMQVQIFDSHGNIVADTSGLMSQNVAPDYEEAVESPSGTGSFVGKGPSGEHIMAETFLLTDTGNGVNGAVRWVISMTPLYRRFLISMAAAIAFGAVLVVFVAFSGRYFNRSIVVPVREVSRTARKIAMGDFHARLEVKESDEIGELCDTINYMANELSTAEEMKNDFISSVSHELRTPLTAIKGWGETAKMAVNNRDAELTEKGINVILSETDRLQGLVEELLDFSRIQSGRLSVNMSLINVAGIIDDAAGMYDEIARRHGIVVRVVRPKTLPQVTGDLNRLKQVFINIIDNAVKYTQSDGFVDVKVCVEDGFIRVIISDTGVGIPEKDIDRVKEKFYKANKTVRGSGIGLAVADEILKQHDGLLFIESKENEGTTVTVVLPVAKPKEDETETPQLEIKPTELNVSVESGTEGNEKTDGKDEA